MASAPVLGTQNQIWLRTRVLSRIETYPLQFNLQPNGGGEGCSNIHSWQSHVEIEDYSIAYFDRITVFEALHCRTSVKGGAHTCFIDT